MKIKTEEVRAGKHTGKKVWICHYFRPELDKKPLRNVPPTFAVVASNDDLPKGKTIYYSKTHFRPIGSGGKVLAKVISPVDNTGFRQRHGNEIYVFDNRDECVAEWNSQINEVCGRIKEREETAAQAWREERLALIDSCA